MPGGGTPGARLLGSLSTLALRLLCRSWRVRARGLERLDRLLTTEAGVIVVFWHGGYLPLFALLSGRRGTVFTSDSLRGRVIGEVCRRFGYRCVTLAARTGPSPLTLMTEALHGGGAAAFAVDGPLGPRHVVKPGAIRVAAALGWPILPVAAAGRRAWTCGRRWDRMQLPGPFTVVGVTAGDPLRVSNPLGNAELLHWQGRVREALETVERKASALARRDPCAD